MYTGPHLIKDNLVFGYDTGYGVADNSTATRFYAGKSVDNEFYNSGANGNILDHSSGYGGYGTVQTGVLDASGTTQNAVYRKTGKIRFGPTGGQDIGTLTNGNTYTFSIYLRHVAGQTESTSMEFDIVDQSSGGYNFTGTLGSNMTYEWKRFSVTSTHTNSSNYHFIDLGTYQGTNVFEWCMPQIESGTVASPFTSTERSSTQSLIDLKRTTDIDVSNVSFDSTGQLTFDGTDDRIAISNIPNKPVSQITCEAVINPSRTPSTGTIRGAAIGDQSTLYLGIINSIDAGVGHALHWALPLSNGSRPSSWHGSIPKDKFTHIVGTYDGSTTRAYVNGVEVWSSSASGTVGGTTYNVGIYNNRTNDGTHNFEGPIPIAKIYNKGLSPQEVKQNFNTYKNRFGI